MIDFIRKLVSIFMGGDDSTSRGYHSMISKKCDICNKVPEYVYRFNAAWLCEPCFTDERVRFPGVVPSDEDIN
jgi:hypothetical protein